jgi:hypothetical protein
MRKRGALVLIGMVMALLVGLAAWAVIDPPRLHMAADWRVRVRDRVWQP